MQREEPPVMTTGLERIAAKARCEPKLRFTSLAHHLTKERVWENLCQIPAKSAAGVDGETVTETKESFEEWIAAMLQSVHRRRISSAGDPAGLYPEARKARDAPSGRADCSGPGTPTKRLSGAIGHLRARLSVLLVRWTYRKGRPPSAGNAPRADCWREDRVGVGGGPQELFWELKSRVDAPLCGTPSGRSAPD